MRMFFISKKGAAIGGIYALAFALFAIGSSMMLPYGIAAEGDCVDAPPPWRCGDADSNKVSLAINVDWGEEYLPQILDTLAQHDAHATFFLTGRWCDNNIELAKKIALAGHELGNHGYSHTSPNASQPEEIADEIERTERAVLLATGVSTRLYAPPSGECEDHVLRAAAGCGYHTILWSVDTIDWQKPDTETVIRRVEDKIHGGAIILAHPTECTMNALDRLLSDLIGEGYEFVTVSDNLGI